MEAAKTLRQRLLVACDWVDIVAVLDEAQRLFVAGVLTGAEVEALTAVCVARSRIVPERAAQ